MKTLLVTSLLVFASIPAMACGDSFIVFENRCVDLTEEMRSPLRSVMKRGEINTSEPNYFVPGKPSTIETKTKKNINNKPVDPFTKRPNNIVETPKLNQI